MGVEGCTISEVAVNGVNEASGIMLTNASNNIVANSSIWGLIWGGAIYFETSLNNKIFGNIIEAYYGPSIYLDNSSGNEFFHNQFYVYEATQVHIGGNSINVWNDGYPSGGNYWSDYTGLDIYSGPYQNETGSDGIGDTPYIIDANNRDRYPLMYPWGSGTPIAIFSWSPLIPEVGEIVAFDASASEPIGGEIISYEWDFGDGSYASGKVVTHAYSSAGTFTVTLNVTDSEGLWDIEQKQITVKAPPPPLAVSITPLSASILVGRSVTFTSTVSGGYPPYTYQWFLNGNPISGATSPSWTFTPTTSGIYYIQLKVTDDKGNTAQSETARIAVATVPVGGYSIPVQSTRNTWSITLYIAITTILTITLTKTKPKQKKQ